MGDREMVEELLLFLENLDGINSNVKSDHILNLLQEVEGRLPDDRERMTEPIHKFLAMPSDDQLLYMVGRRAGIFSRLDDLTDTELAGHAHGIVLDPASGFGWMCRGSTPASHRSVA